MHIGTEVQAPLRYEFPLTERVRLLLRLEDTAARIREQAAAASPESHRYALAALCELMELTTRIDLHSEIRIEADRQRTLLRNLRHLAAVDSETLDGVLSELEAIIRTLDAHSDRAGSRCREDGWLAMVRARMALPGGLTRFDTPSFHCWSAIDASARRDRLLEWLSDFACATDSAAILLGLLRRSAETESQRAPGGQFMRTLSRQPLLVTIDTERGSMLVPEISANRSSLLVRFMHFSPTGRPRPCEDAVEFGLAVTYCG